MVTKRKPDMLSQTDKILKLIAMLKYIESRREYFYGKMHRAKNSKTYDLFRKKFQLYRNFSNRTFNLYFEVRKNYKFGETPKYLIQRPSDYQKYEEERIAKGKKIFLTKHTYSMWFLQNGLHCDYGSFICERCGDNFSHSPSRIKLAAKSIFECCCGYCTNEIIKSDWNECPYE